MIYLIRHGQTAANAEKRYQGRTDSPLTETGQHQVGSAVRMLDKVHIDSIITSPLVRCAVLAEEMAVRHGVSMERDARIAELDFGVFEMLNYEEAQAKYPEEWKRWVDCGCVQAPPEGEGLDVFEKRVRAFSKDLMYAAKTQDIVVVTHGGVLTSLICNLLDLDIKSKWRFRTENGTVLKICVADGFAYLDL